jgi:hypothetical protein
MMLTRVGAKRKHWCRRTPRQQQRVLGLIRPQIPAEELRCVVGSRFSLPAHVFVGVDEATEKHRLYLRRVKPPETAREMAEPQDGITSCHRIRMPGKSKAKRRSPIRFAIHRGGDYHARQLLRIVPLNGGLSFGARDGTGFFVFHAAGQ